MECFRTIFLIIILINTMEEHDFSHLTAYTEMVGPNMQFGFRYCYSIVHQINQITNTIATDLKKKLQIIIIFFILETKVKIN